MTNTRDRYEKKKKIMSLHTSNSYNNAVTLFANYVIFSPDKRNLLPPKTTTRGFELSPAQSDISLAVSLK